MAAAKRNKPRMTVRQRLVWNWMRLYQAKHRQPPTHREIADAVDFGSTNSVVCHIRSLVMRGAVKEIAPMGSYRRYQAVPIPAKELTNGARTAS
jgi:SOS-response transcriptional repressor LexA